MRALALTLLLTATHVSAITIIGTVPENTSVSITVPSSLNGPYSDSAISVFDMTFDYTVTCPNCVGQGAMMFKTDLIAQSFMQPASAEQMTSRSTVEAPFFFMTQPIFQQGSVSQYCGEVMGEEPCTVAFEFNVPLRMHWRIVSEVSYSWSPFGAVQPELLGQTISASSEVQLLWVGQFDQQQQMWNFFPNATVTIATVNHAPEPSSFLLMMAPVVLCCLRRSSFLKARVPARGQD